MKVGIITYHYGANYGGTLQCLALQTAVAQLGHEVEILNFVPGTHRRTPIWRGWEFHRSGLRKASARLVQLRHGSKCLNAFEKFRTDHLSLTAPLHSLEDLRATANRYDAIITGSDQVWNFRCSPAYFLDLDERFTGKRISYAACCTQENQPAERIAPVGAWVKKFDHVSVRDALSQKAIENATGSQPQIVCDPTLLMKTDWLLERSNVPDSSSRILVYRLGRPFTSDMKAVLQHLKSRTGCQTSEGIVASTFNPHTSTETDIVHYQLGPREWVEKIKGAGLLITDSYHGILFALRMQIPFLAYCEELDRSPRLSDLSVRFGLDSRILKNPDDLNDIPDDLLWQPETISPMMRQHIDQSLDYLSTSLA